MPAGQILLAGKAIRLHGAINDPDFRTQRVLSTDPWDYVSLWLRRHHKNESLFFWEQAKHFFAASSTLPPLAAPLTNYYSLLNATKALLTAKGQEFSDLHGIKGGADLGHKSLANEFIDFKGGGILPALCAYLDEPDNAGKKISLKDIFWQMPFIHRAFRLTYRSSTELFIPLTSHRFMRIDGSRDAWFEADIDLKYVNAQTKKTIGSGYELIQLQETQRKQFIIRRKKRFSWSSRDLAEGIPALKQYHKEIRKKVVPIFAAENRWYLKKSVAGHEQFNNSQLTLIFAAMHRLSELSRYDPMNFSKHFGVSHNWLLSEFIKTAPSQFIFGIASEITGHEFIIPDAF